jgi:hypothetical protein
MQNTKTTVTSKSASDASGTIGKARKSKTGRRLANYVVMVRDEPENAFATTSVLLAGKQARKFRKQGFNVDEMVVTKNGRNLGWASLASIVSVERRKLAAAK